MVEIRLRAFPVLRLEGLEDFVLGRGSLWHGAPSGGDGSQDAGCLIAAPCIRAGAPLLHADADYFDRLVTCKPLRAWTD